MRKRGLVYFIESPFSVLKKRRETFEKPQSYLDGIKKVIFGELKAVSRHTHSSIILGKFI